MLLYNTRLTNVVCVVCRVKEDTKDTRWALPNSCLIFRGTDSLTFIAFHSLFVSSLSLSQGDKGQRGNDGTDGRKVSYRLQHANNAALAVCPSLFCWFVPLVFLIRVRLVSLVFPAVKDLPDPTWVVYLKLRITPLLWSCILASTGAPLTLIWHIADSLNRNQVDTDR